MKTTNSMKRDYIEMRDYVCQTVMHNVKYYYAGDNDVLSGVSELIAMLKVADPNEEFVRDLKGFMFWAEMTKQDGRSALTTIIHDLGEFAKNRHQSWFCPRSSGYAKYLTGAGG